MTTREFTQKLIEIDSIKFGEFTLKSGEISNIYLDLRNIISNPHLLQEITDLIIQKSQTYDRVCGVPYAALPLATTYSIKTETPQIIKRKEAKKWGTGKLIEGHFNEGDTVILLEDVITSGISLLETIKELEDVGLKIGQILTIVDRGGGGTEKIREAGYNIDSLFTLQDILDITEKPNKWGDKLLQVSKRKSTNVIASVDITKSKEILKFLESIGSGICAVKLHVDIIEDFDWDFIVKLVTLSRKLDFLIIEDRKFADIGNTQLNQITGGFFRISSWADYITVHLIGGESTLKAISNLDIGIIPIIEMSSEGALTDENYIKNCEKFLYKYENVCGVVAQNFSPKGNLLKFTPGINLSNTQDGLGQQWNTPEYAKNVLNSDFIIVGRGLYLSENPSQEIKKYLI